MHCRIVLFFVLLFGRRVYFFVCVLEVVFSHVLTFFRFIIQLCWFCYYFQFECICYNLRMLLRNCVLCVCVNSLVSEVLCV